MTSFNTWLDSTEPGEKLDAGEFARSAIGELPRVETKVRRLNPELWPECDLEGEE